MWPSESVRCKGDGGHGMLPGHQTPLRPWFRHLKATNFAFCHRKTGRKLKQMGRPGPRAGSARIGQVCSGKILIVTRDDSVFDSAIWYTKKLEAILEAFASGGMAEARLLQRQIMAGREKNSPVVSLTPATPDLAFDSRIHLVRHVGCFRFRRCRGCRGC